MEILPFQPHQHIVEQIKEEGIWIAVVVFHFQHFADVIQTEMNNELAGFPSPASFLQGGVVLSAFDDASVSTASESILRVL